MGKRKDKMFTNPSIQPTQSTQPTQPTQSTQPTQPTQSTSSKSTPSSTLPTQSTQKDTNTQKKNVCKSIDTSDKNTTFSHMNMSHKPIPTTPNNTPITSPTHTIHSSENNTESIEPIKNKENKENKEKREKRERTLSEILEEDDKILFSLQALGGVQKNEKLTENGELISVDDRWFLQGLRRWWSYDSRERSSNKILLIIKKAETKILELLDMDYMTQEENKKKGSLEYKKQQEENDDRKKLIQKYCIALSKAKTGIENIRDTYEDKFTKNSCTLSIQKIDDIIEKIQKPYS